MYSLVVIAFGFISAALITSITSMKSAHVGQLSLINNPYKSWPGFAILMLTGPYLLAKNGLHLWNGDIVSKGVVLFCFLLAFLWSFCQGVLVTQLLMLSGLLVVPTF